jgi:hypothetical protein
MGRSSNKKSMNERHKHQHTYTYTPRSDGALEVRGPKTRQVWYPWGAPGGYRVEGKPHTQDERTRFRLREALISAPRNHPLALLFQNMPLTVRARVTALMSLHHEALILAQANQRAFLTCPTLILLPVLEAMALPLFQFDVSGNALDWAAQAVPNSDLAYHVARKFERSLTGHFHAAPHLDLLWPAFINRGALRVLRHCSSLTDEHLMLAGLGEPLIRSPLLMEAVAGLDYPVYTQCSRILNYRARLGLTRWPYGRELQSLKQLWRIADRLALRLAREGLNSDLVYPEPPYEPDCYVRWIATQDELDWLGDTYHNCLGSYHAACLAGLSAAYETQDEDNRSYVIVLTRRGGCWEVEGAEYPHNQRVSKAEIARIMRYFKGDL